MGPALLSAGSGPPYRPAWARPRRCLLKGCGHWFLPTRPQCRYCSYACRQAARRWRRWRAQQKYRTTAHGRSHRQQQASRYRQRLRTRSRPSPPVQPEGKRLLKKGQEVPQRGCDRPGCYVLFPLGSAYNPRRFCCPLCRQALRCVLDRESRWRRRRRRGLRRPGRRTRAPPLHWQ
jgi:hypothetical protein